MDGLIQKDKREASSDFLNKIFVFTLMWSIGALLELDDRKKMQNFISGKIIYILLSIIHLWISSPKQSY